MSANDLINWSVHFITPLAPVFLVVIAVSQSFRIINGVYKLFKLR